MKLKLDKDEKIILPFLIIALIIILAIVFSNIRTKNINNNTKLETKSTSSSELTKEDILFKLSETNNFIVDMWNNSINETKWYIEAGTDSVGGTYSYSKAVKNADKIMTKFDDYNTFIISLDENKYKDIKSVWNELVPEMKNLYEYLKNNEPEANSTNYKFDTTKFNELMYDFSEEIYLLSNY